MAVVIGMVRQGALDGSIIVDVVGRGCRYHGLMKRFVSICWAGEWELKILTPNRHFQ